MTKKKIPIQNLDPWQKIVLFCFCSDKKERERKKEIKRDADIQHISCEKLANKFTTGGALAGTN
jgi:hypothetical protein